MKALRIVNSILLGLTIVLCFGCSNLSEPNSTSVSLDMGEVFKQARELSKDSTNEQEIGVTISTFTIKATLKTSEDFTQEKEVVSISETDVKDKIINFDPVEIGSIISISLDVFMDDVLCYTGSEGDITVEEKTKVTIKLKKLGETSEPEIIFDTTPPLDVTNLTATIQGKSIILTWDSSSSDDVGGYLVSWNNNQGDYDRWNNSRTIAPDSPLWNNFNSNSVILPKEKCEYVLNNASYNKPYNFIVRAVDTSGNISETLSAEGTTSTMIVLNVGDLILQDNTIVPYEHGREHLGEPACYAIAIIAGFRDDGTAIALAGNAPDMYLEGKICSREEINCVPNIQVDFTTSGTPGNYTYSNFTLDLDGSDNWYEYSLINSYDETFETVEENYPAFYFALGFMFNTYYLWFTKDFQDGWYIPSLYELFIIYNNREILYEVTSMLDDGTLWLENSYWSSSMKFEPDTPEDKIAPNFYFLNFEDGQIDYSKDPTTEASTLVIRKY